MKKNQIYQLVSFVNAFNKRTKKWESLRSVQNVYVGKEGLSTAYSQMENLREFILIYDSGFKEITRHYDIKNVKECYLNNKVRSGRGTLEVCIKVLENGYYESKYSEVRVKVEIHIPHIHEDGSLAYYGDKIILSYNPSNI